MNTKTQTIEQTAINTVRTLAVDAVQKANSGHPGTPMGLAPVGHVLWTESMNFNPENSQDSFFTGYNITLDDIKNFRQLHSKTAGHPEYGLLAGIEVTGVC